MKNKIFAIGFLAAMVLVLAGCIKTAEKTPAEEEAVVQTEEERLEIGQEAHDGGDPGICDEIEDENQRAACKFNIIIDKAGESQDASLCKTIGDEKLINECKEAVATGGV